MALFLEHLSVGIVIFGNDCILSRGEIVTKSFILKDRSLITNSLRIVIPVLGNKRKFSSFCKSFNSVENITITIIRIATCSEYGIIKINGFTVDPIYMLTKKVSKFNGFGEKGLHLFNDQSFFTESILNLVCIKSKSGLQSISARVAFSKRPELIKLISSKIMDEPELKKVLYPFY